MASNLFDNSLTIYQQAFRNLLYLSNNFTFDLYMLLGLSEDSPAEGEDYIEWFMNRERGTSAHFASALSMLCRLQGIPSRIAVGFSYGERDGSDFVIRAVDVHAWTEIFIPVNGVGRWVQFDSAPMPPIAPPPYDTLVIRDRYGENTIGFQATFHCSNEFFFEDQHFDTTTLAPNPSSDAWYYYLPTSSWYGPYINRSQSFTLYSFLGNGNENDFYLYLLDDDLRGLIPIEGEEVFFIDITSGETLGSAFTNSSGYATFDYAYNNSAISGLHLIEADWSGIRAATYDLRFLPTEIATGVIVAGSVNVSSVDPEIRQYFEFSTSSSFEDSNIQLIKVITEVESSQDIWYIRLLRNVGVLPEIISFFRSN
ncbi:MAG: transglutaminase-like domain-containing protein [Candidatus Heimdallarchaeota archaeon]